MPGACLLILLVAPPAESATRPDTQVLAEAESSFRAGLAEREDPGRARSSFLQAATDYEELRRRGADNAALYGNLGNTYLLAGDLPRSIVAYRHGLRIAPSDRRLQEGLAFARSQVAYPAGSALGRPPVEQRPPWLSRVSSAWYVTIALVAHGLGCISLARWWITRRVRLLGLSGTAFLVAILSFAGLVAEEWRDADFANRPVVVISDDGVLLRSGNGLRYPPRSDIPLNRGVEARLLYARGDWLQIELSGGEVGWVPREYALVDGSASD
ncbi:MAG TPA: hypothetical protein VKE94_13350 [Gemmataceae bacterium]|nr:hypothetical protein [Gemmataceae bacterium]